MQTNRKIAMDIESIDSILMHDAELVHVVIGRTSTTEVCIRTVIHDDEEIANLIRLGLGNRNLDIILDVSEAKIADLSGKQTGMQYIDDWRAERIADASHPTVLGRLTFSTSMGSHYEFLFCAAHLRDWA